jgi:2-oxoglutarate ferredoxin oxidoreductase subunit beta
VTVLAHNNRVYGLTKGQASPTSDLGMQTKLQPKGVINEPFNPLTTALALGCGFVARAFSNDIELLSEIIQAGVHHQGFALIDILQPCVTFNRINTHRWYKQRIQRISAQHDTADLEAAFALARQWGQEIPVGIFFQKQSPSFTQRIEKLKAGSLVSRHYDPKPLEAVLGI